MAVLVTFAVGQVGCSSVSKYCCPTEENTVVVLIRSMLQNAPQRAASVGTPGEILFRDVDGRILFRAKTDEHGRGTLPIDYRAVVFGQEVECRVDLGAGYFIGSLQAARPGIHVYYLPLAFPEMYAPEPFIPE